MVGTDRSETAEQAVRWAADFAKSFDAELHVVQVVTPLGDVSPNGSRRDLDSLSSDLADHARSIAGSRARGTVVVGDDPALAIVRAAAEAHADVLVVGDAGMAGRREFLLGNVPNRVTHNARCTVVVVKTGAGDGPVSARAAYYTAELSAAYPGPIARGAEIAAVLAKYGVRELLAKPDGDGEKGAGRRGQAKRLRAALEELGPTFAKLGQILSTRPDLLPPEFIEELSQLRDRVAPLSEGDVVRVMEQELGVPWEDVFETIDPLPLAAGTIGQVHRATLASDQRVVVKVQRRDARAVIEQDLALLEMGIGAVGSSEVVKRRIDLAAVFEHLSASLQQELDFRREAANAERLRESVAGFSRLAVPAIHERYTTSRLLVMQDVAGGSLEDVPPALRQETARQFLEFFYKQILIDGFFHADPHPGNLMWQANEQRLYFLDMGMVGEVGPETRELLILLLMAFWHGDSTLLTDVILTLAQSTHRADIDVPAFSSDMRELMNRVRGSSIRDIPLGVVLQDMLDIAFRHDVPIPASLALTVKALAQMQSAAALLDPHVDPFEVAGRFITQSALRRMVTKADPKMLMFEAQKLKLRAGRLLEALERLVGTRPGDKLEVNIRGASLEEAIRRVGQQIALGVVGGLALLASAFTGNARGSTNVWSIVFGAAGLAALGVLTLGFVRRRKQ
jgi:predicted unusual protein kinase regulating ubiquinone biosynthesis (AarF/ABC1/UbiB family)/nucleotide-binding universal stress UspA family protein